MMVPEQAKPAGAVLVGSSGCQLHQAARQEVLLAPLPAWASAKHQMALASTPQVVGHGLHVAESQVGHDRSVVHLDSLAEAAHVERRHAGSLVVACLAGRVLEIQGVEACGRRPWDRWACVAHRALALPILDTLLAALAPGPAWHKAHRGSQVQEDVPPHPHEHASHLEPVHVLLQVVPPWVAPPIGCDGVCGGACGGACDCDCGPSNCWPCRRRGGAYDVFASCHASFGRGPSAPVPSRGWPKAWRESAQMPSDFLTSKAKHCYRWRPLPQLLPLHQ